MTFWQTILASFLGAGGAGLIGFGIWYVKRLLTKAPRGDAITRMKNLIDALDKSGDDEDLRKRVSPLLDEEFRTLNRPPIDHAAASRAITAMRTAIQSREFAQVISEKQLSAVVAERDGIISFLAYNTLLDAALVTQVMVLRELQMECSRLGGEVIPDHHYNLTRRTLAELVKSKAEELGQIRAIVQAVEMVWHPKVWETHRNVSSIVSRMLENNPDLDDEPKRTVALVKQAIDDFGELEESDT